MMSSQRWIRIAGAALVVATLALTALPASSAPYHLQEHMTSAGAQKCRAFRRVSRDARALQGAQGGTLSPGAQRRLERELHKARAMPPASITARRCGVAL